MFIVMTTVINPKHGINILKKNTGLKTYGFPVTKSQEVGSRN